MRNDSLPQDQLRTEGVVAIGWDDKIGADVIGQDYPDVKALVRRAYPEITERQVGNWSGQVWLFCSAMEQGDVVVAPFRGTGTVDLGVVSGRANWEGDAPIHKFRLPVEWVELGTRRAALSELSRRGLKSQLTCYTHGSGDDLREIVESRRGVNGDDVRRLVIEQAAGANRAGIDPDAYEEISRSDDPVRAVRELVGHPVAQRTFQQLHAAGRSDLSLENLVVQRHQAIGMPPAVVERARDRLEYYGR